jgi:hypothetical protein
LIIIRPDGTTPRDGCAAMRRVTNECPGLKQPETIRSRLLRRYIGTNLQVIIYHYIIIMKMIMIIILNGQPDWHGVNRLVMYVGAFPLK